MRTWIASAALVLAALPLAVGVAFASDEKVPAKAFVRSFCKLTVAELDGIAASRSWFDTTIVTAPTREAFRDTLVTHLDRQLAAVDGFIQGLDAAGIPNVANGRKFVRFHLRNEMTYRGALAKARDDAIKIDLTDAALVSQTLQRIEAEGRAASAAYDDALASAKLPVPELDRLFDRLRVCRKVRTQVRPGPTRPT
jgi:hypothetical protein